jgi:hypothetical protein
MLQRMNVNTTGGAPLHTPAPRGGRAPRGKRRLNLTERQKEALQFLREGEAEHDRDGWFVGALRIDRQTSSKLIQKGLARQAGRPFRWRLALTDKGRALAEGLAS